MQLGIGQKRRRNLFLHLSIPAAEKQNKTKHIHLIQSTDCQVGGILQSAFLKGILIPDAYA